MMSSSDVKEVKIAELRRALAECEAEHGPRHVKTAQAALTLAIHRQYDHPEGFAEAESLALRAADIYESVGGAYRRCLAGPFRMLASIREKQENLVEAESLRRQAIELSQENGEDQPFQDEELQTLGYLLLKQRRYVEACEFFERALHVAEQHNGRDYRYLGNFLQPLARAYLGLKRYDDAIETLRRELALCVQHRASDTDERARLLEQIAGAQNAAGQPDLADESLREARQLRVQLDGEQQAKYGHLPHYDAQREAMENLVEQADALIARKDFVGAMALIEQVLDHRASRCEAGRDYQSELLRKLANCHSQLGQYTAAEAVLNQARGYLESKAMPLEELRQKLIDQRASPTWRPGSLIKPIGMYYSESLAWVVHELGQVQHRQGRSAEAIQNLQTAITIWKVTHEKANGFVSIGLLSIGSILGLQGDLDQGSEFVEEGLAWERNLQADSPFVADISANLAEFRKRQGRLDEAVTLFLSAVEIVIKNEGISQPKALIGLNEAGQLLIRLSQWDRARACFLRALGLVREATWPSNQPIVGLLLSLSAVELRQNHFAQAVPYLREALPLCESDPERLADEHAAVLRDLTESLVLTNQWEEAESVGLRWLAKLKRSMAPDHPALPVALANLARTYHALRRGAQALPLIEQAIPLVAALAGSNTRAVANYYHIQAEILQGLNRFAAAKAALAHAKQLDK